MVGRRATWKSAPAENDIAAGARTVHDSRAFERRPPATEQIAIRPNGCANAVQSFPVESRRVVRRVFHERSFGAVFVNDDGLAINFEIVITPANQFLEQVF